ncbi:MAG: hypothetical protein EHM50_11005 [Lysobacterales bacterium]|nr:MAG: hypothetical protein EHM50_11005 [Xanthomonadales bacterium]
MTIFAIIKEALRIARAHKSLWLFGFLAGLTGFNGGGGGGQQGATSVPASPPELGTMLLVGLIIIALIVAFVILKFLSTGALIEGVKRARRNGAMTVREGFREGWAHWGVLFRVALLYLLMNAGSAALLFGTCYLVWLAFGSPAVFVAAGVAVLVGVPWLLTLYMWQAFAERIAVLENRHALDAIRKARLFLHGRLQLGLKLLVAGFLGVLAVAALGFLVIGPLILLVAALVPVWGSPAVAIGVLALPPAVFVVVAFIGIMTSSVWTIGYLTQVER